MSHPYHHARSSAKTFQCHWQAHYHIHAFLDSSKAHLADARHRCLLHSLTGVQLLKQLPSPIPPETIQKITEQHILEDIGKIPRLTEWISPTHPFEARWEELLTKSRKDLKTELSNCSSSQEQTDRLQLLDILLIPETTEPLLCHPARLLLFTSPGPFLCESLLGPVLPCQIPTRTLCETLIKTTFGKIPSLQDYLAKTKVQDWMYKNAAQLSNEPLI